MYGSLPFVGRYSRRLCAHLNPLVRTAPQVDGTKIETCPQCGARWVTWPSGTRMLARWAH